MSLKRKPIFGSPPWSLSIYRIARLYSIPVECSGVRKMEISRTTDIEKTTSSQRTVKSYDEVALVK